MRGEWIEISTAGSTALRLLGLSPCGESGLKCFRWRPALTAPSSLPMRGEWIEIVRVASLAALGAVSPHAGRVD